MQKTLVKRSYFQFHTLTTGVKTVNVEGDEVYITVVGPSTTGAKVRRQRERDMVTFLAENPTITTGAVQTWGTVDITYGRVPLDAPLDLDGKLTNKVVTTAAGDLKQAERSNHPSVGFKEKIDLSPVVDGSVLAVVIETVEYVTADNIGM